MLAVISALVGVILGGLVAAAWNFWLKVFEIRLGRRVAARSLRNALSHTRSAARSARSVKAPELVAARNLELLLENWNTHRAALATLPRASWLRVEVAVAFAQVSLDQGLLAKEWTATSDTLLSEMADAASAAIDALTPYTTDGRGPIAWWLRRP